MPEEVKHSTAFTYIYTLKNRYFMNLSKLEELVAIYLQRKLFLKSKEIHRRKTKNHLQYFTTTVFIYFDTLVRTF